MSKHVFQRCTECGRVTSGFRILHLQDSWFCANCGYTTRREYVGPEAKAGSEEESVREICARYATLTGLLRTFVDKASPPGTVVHVSADRYCGFGFATLSDGCPPDKLPVNLENGNTWYYPLYSVTKATQRALWPPWVRRRFLRQKGYQLL